MPTQPIHPKLPVPPTIRPQTRLLGSPLLLATLGLLMLAPAAVGQAVRLLDAPFSQQIGSSTPAANPIVTLGNRAVFVSADPVNGSELWSTDGTTEGTIRLTDLWPGQGNGVSRLSATSVVGNQLVFIGTTPEHGSEPWITDGTVAGTRLLRELTPGTTVPTSGVFGLNGKVLILTPQEVWISEGTTAGTQRIGVAPSGTSYGSAVPQLFGSGVVVSYSPIGFLLTDGTEAGSRWLTPPGVTRTDNGSERAKAIGNRLYFVATSPTAATGTYVTDGTEQGTIRISTDIPAQSSSSDPVNFVPFNGEVYFRNELSQLWATQGTAATTRRVLQSLNVETPPVVMGGQMYFVSSVPGSFSGSALRRSDGTEAGTRIVRTGLSSSATVVGSEDFVLVSQLFAEPFVVQNDIVRSLPSVASGENPLVLMPAEFGPAPGFRLIGHASGVPQWPLATNGAQFRSQPTTIAPGNVEGRIIPQSIARLNGSLIVQGIESGVGYSTLFRLDPSTLALTPIAAPGAGRGRGLPVSRSAEVGDVWLTTGSSGSPSNVRLFTRTGPDGGLPSLPLDLGSGNTAVGLSDLVQADGAALAITGSINQPISFLRLTPGANAWEPIARIDPPPGIFPFEYSLGVSDGQRYWAVIRPGYGNYELWTVDIANGGATRFGSLPSALSSTGPSVLFRVGPGWVIGSGAFSGSAFVADALTGLIRSVQSPFQPSTNLGSMDNAVPWRNGVVFNSSSTLLYLERGSTMPVSLRFGLELVPLSVGNRAPLGVTANGVIFGVQFSGLWVTDGTVAGTRAITPSSGISPRSPRGMTTLKDRVVFVASTTANGLELWASDGTDSGTRLLADIWPGPTSSGATSLTAVGDYVYFFATSPDAGAEPWRTDGTPEGTRRLADVVPGVVGSSPNFIADPQRSPAFGRIGGRLIFYAWTPELGTQIYTVDEPFAIPTDYDRDGQITLDDLCDFITDFYAQPAIPGGVQAMAPQNPGVARGFGVACPAAPDAPLPYDPAAYRTLGYRVGFSADGSNVCPTSPDQLFPNLDHLAEYITLFYAGSGA